jgi:hypothetical protein
MFMRSVKSRELQRCRRLRQAILAWASEGKLVDQDPADTSRYFAYSDPCRAGVHGRRFVESETLSEAESSVMSDQSERISRKLWSYCTVLLDDGLGSRTTATGI